MSTTKQRTCTTLVLSTDLEEGGINSGTHQSDLDRFSLGLSIGEESDQNYE